MIVKFVCAILLAALPSSNVFVSGAGDPLIVIPEVASSNGLLMTKLDLVEATIDTPDLQLRSRLFNGSLPGPTLRLQPGDTVVIEFCNNLPPGRGNPHANNQISGPDETNLHFHGLFITGELPSDDSLLTVLPGECYTYNTTLPQEHLGGTHWLHPHRHGATALQVAGGAAAAVIVEDNPSYLPPAQVTQAREVVLVVQQFDAGEIIGLSQQSGINDNLASSPHGNFNLVNGQKSPVVSIDAGEWVRFRFVYAAWRGDKFQFSISGCETFLLAKDGVYIRDYPRSIGNIILFLGGRSDVMVRCPNVNTDYSIGGIATIRTTGNQVTSQPLTPWAITYPPYLQDLRGATVKQECSCRTVVSQGGGINGYRFDKNRVMHETPLGEVAERRIDADGHPYHQHVYPFQLQSGGDGGYIQVGDWYDTFDGGATVRYQPMMFDTKIMVHCHKLEHEDEGMMSIDYVNSTFAACTCTAPRPLPWWIILLAALGGVLVLATGGYLFFAWRRGRWPWKRVKQEDPDEEEEEA